MVSVALGLLRLTAMTPQSLRRYLLTCSVMMACSADLARGNEFALLIDDCDALAARVAVMLKAEQEICLATFSIDSSFAPTAILSLLRERAQAGVRVRVLLDGLMTEISTDMERYLTEGGVEIGIFHPLLSGHPAWLNRRLHSKLIVIDRQVMVLGSRNLNDTHFGLEEPNFVDYDAMVAGSICGQAADYFDALWDSPDVRPVRECFSVHRQRSCELAGTGLRSPQTAAAQSLSRLHQQVAKRLDERPPLATIDIDAQELCLLHDNDTAKSEQTMAATVMEMIDKAERSVIIESPYPAFSNRFLDCLLHAADREVKVTLITNSLNSTNEIIVYAAYQRQKDRLLRSGVNLYEFPGPARLHAKAMIVDDRLAMLGSYNFDARAERLNLELCLLTSNPQAIATIQQIMCEHQLFSTRIDRRQLNASPNAELSRRLRLRSAQLIAPLLRRSL